MWRWHLLWPYRPVTQIYILISILGLLSAYGIHPQERYSPHSPRFLNRFHLNTPPFEIPPMIGMEMTAGTDNDCSVFPNQTLFEPHFYSCDSEDKPPVFLLHDLALSNQTGDYVYPLDFSQPLRVFLDLTSSANRRLDNIRAEVTLYRRSVGWLGCGWFYIPTLGLLDNYDICGEDNLSCPIYTGRQVVEVVLRPNVLFLALMKLIHSDRVPYQVIIKLINNRSSSEELLCAAFQSRINF